MKLSRKARSFLLVGSLSLLPAISFANTQTDSITKALQTRQPKDVVQAFLLNSGKENVKNAAEKLVAEDATYVSLNFDNPELEKIEPWTGTRKGRQYYIDTFSDVGTYWKVNDFKVTDLISEGETVAVFGNFNYTSVVAKNTIKSPFAIIAKVHNGQITYFQFMEDTYATASSFRTSGKWTIQHKEGDANKFEVGK